MREIMFSPARGAWGLIHSFSQSPSMLAWESVSLGIRRDLVLKAVRVM